MGFVGVTAPSHTQHRVIMNTILALGSGAFITYLMQFMRFLQPRGKLIMQRLVHSALAGGVAISSAHALVITPYAAVLTGIVGSLFALIASELASWWLFN